MTPDKTAPKPRPNKPSHRGDAPSELGQVRTTALAFRVASLMGVDFAALSLMDALDLAVLVEEEAKDRYGDLAELMELHHTPEAARFFRFMAGNEEKHRVELSVRRLALFGDEPTRVTRRMVFEVEAPEFDKMRAVVSLREALQVALHAEKKARAFFVEAALRVRDAGVKALFTELQNEEAQHYRLVLAELEKTPP